MNQEKPNKPGFKFPKGEFVFAILLVLISLDRKTTAGGTVLEYLPYYWELYIWILVETLTVNYCLLANQRATTLQGRWTLGPIYYINSGLFWGEVSLRPNLLYKLWTFARQVNSSYKIQVWTQGGDTLALDAYMTYI